jgi:hypothetical protein
MTKKGVVKFQTSLSYGRQDSENVSLHVFISTLNKFQTKSLDPSNKQKNFLIK